MKKLIVVCAAVAMGFAVQAASVDWVYSVTGADANDTSLYTGYSAYLFDKATWDAVDFATMAVDDVIKDSYDNSTFGSKTVGMGTNKKRTWGTVNGSTVAATRGAVVNDKAAGGDAFNGYIVIFNADIHGDIPRQGRCATRGMRRSGRAGRMRCGVPPEGDCSFED